MTLNHMQAAIARQSASERLESGPPPASASQTLSVQAERLALVLETCFEVDKTALLNTSAAVELRKAIDLALRAHTRLVPAAAAARRTST